MTAASRQRLRHAIQNGVFVVLVIVLAGLIAVLARQHAVQWDLTSAGRNSLSPASADVLRKLDGPIVVTAYATPHDPRLGDLRKHIGDFLARYQRAKHDVRLNFIDPRERPQAAARAGVKVNGELVVEYRERSERLSTLSEFDFTNLLIRLSRTEERLVMSLDGHGERSLTGVANHDLGDFGKQLASKGLKVGTLNLAIAPQVPDDVSVLVIASPQVDILPAEMSKILNHLERGGNLLWLVDQEPLHGLQELGERLGLVLTPGVVVDPDAIERGGRPVMSVAAPGNYGSHPILENMRVNSMFPFARAITVSEFDGWRSTPLVEVAPRGWIETDDLGGRIVFDQAHDTAGPVQIAVALERMREERIQRVVIVGSGHFLANMYLGNGGNLDLGVNIVNWLAGDERLISIQPRSSPDTTLTLSKGWLLTIVIVFLIAIPIGLLAAGALIWWRRRR